MTKHARGRGAVIAAAASSILFLTGCNNAEPATRTEAGAPASAAATGDLTADCTTAVGAFRELFKDLITGAAGDNEKEGVRKALTDYAAKAREHAATVSDPALKAAIEKNAAGAEKVAQSADPSELEDPEFDAATAELEKVCEDALTPSADPSAPTETIGAAGSACEMPVSFDLVALWKPKAVDLAELGEAADLFRVGPFEVVCEVDAKPAGEVGFVRVYLSKKTAGTPREHLEKFVAADGKEARDAGNAEVRKTTYSKITVDGKPAAEVTWEPYNKSLDHASKYSAFAVKTPKGVVVVKLSPFGADEHANVLPAYELAKKTLKINK
ncbi:lipoprotein [Actinoplanes sp. NPDC024001]|uniref:lipoprotein n=1 Tax=Actinoplanes sp. NPDC024001 TaxID=3154598 RepID=UPI0033D3EE4F